MLQEMRVRRDSLLLPQHTPPPITFSFTHTQTGGGGRQDREVQKEDKLPDVIIIINAKLGKRILTLLRGMLLALKNRNKT